MTESDKSQSEEKDQPPTTKNEVNDLIIGDHSIKTTDDNMYQVKGLNPTSKGCGFTIYLNPDFAEALESLSVPDRQENTKDALSKMMDGMMSSLRFSGDSYLLTNITVAGQSTGLDFYRERNEYEYHTHNVDTASQAIEIIAIFAKWVEYAHLVLKDELSKEKQNE